MNRTPRDQPQYRRHKSRNLAVVRINGKDLYLGPWQSPESHRAYADLIDAWRKDQDAIEAGQAPQTHEYYRKLLDVCRAGKEGNAEAQAVAATEEYTELLRELLKEKHSNATGEGNSRATAARFLTVGALCAEYLKSAEQYYRNKNQPGKTSKSVALVRSSLRHVVALYRWVPAENFGPKALLTVRAEMIKNGGKFYDRHKRVIRTVRYSRTHINKMVGVIKRAFKWAVGEELIEAEVWQKLQAVVGLQYGRSDARETDPVRPVDPAILAETLKHLPPIVAAMVEIERLSGMRPGEVVTMRPCDITFDLSGCACYRPSTHKMQYKGRERRIYLGPQAVAILRPFLDRPSDQFCFSPAEVVEWRRQQKRKARKTPYGASHRRRDEKKRKTEPKRRPGARFETASYGRAITAATKAAFPTPAGLDKAQAQDWRRRHDWNPNQLRHAWATRMRELEGIEAASVGLGHASLDVTQIYAERNFELARKFAQQHG